MNVEHALKARKSTRAFINKDVDRKVIEKLLDMARYAASGSNVQPWQVAVVSGNKLKRIKKLLEEAFRAGKKRQMDYQYYPLTWKKIYLRNRDACTAQLYSALNIRTGTRQHFDQWAANYRGFDAPVILFYFLDSSMERGAFIDCGMFIQSFMLAAVSEGLSTCPEASLAEYPSIVKRELGICEDDMLICGMALGYENKKHKINKYRTTRMDIEEFAKFYD